MDVVYTYCWALVSQGFYISFLSSRKIGAGHMSQSPARVMGEREKLRGRLGMCHKRFQHWYHSKQSLCLFSWRSNHYTLEDQKSAIQYRGCLRTA
jgi:hypothetical protein